MTTVLVTGSEGFIGKNVVVALQRANRFVVKVFDAHNTVDELPSLVADADFVVHLAGVNRPPHEADFIRGNADLTKSITDALRASHRKTPLLCTSSTQAMLDNPYGNSKRAAESTIFSYAAETGAPCYVYRLPNVFGKWCRPNYNSVVATFCHNISHGIPITINDGAKALDLVYIDDVVAEFIRVIDGRPEVAAGTFCGIPRVFKVTVGALAEKLYAFRDIRTTHTLPGLDDVFTRFLYATYLSYVDLNDFAYALERRTDERGVLAEMLKSPHFGQIFVSRTRPGFVRGHHYHDTKIEKFCVIDGTAVIRFQQVRSGESVSYCVKGEEMRIIDIPPGYSHAIENTGDRDLIVLFWASEVFAQDIPDTYFREVQ